jgi:hypothetical protein
MLAEKGGCSKGEKVDPVYPGYGRDPADPGDPEDTMAIRGYHGDTEDTCRTNSIKRNRVMKIQNLHDRAIRLMTSHFL